jgi:hypothetical protein
MVAVPAVANSLAAWNDDYAVPDELVGRLYRAGENAVLDMTATLSAGQRASLAAYCYRKSHMHRIGLAIAATCELSTLVQAFGTALGQALYTQSRDRAPVPERTPGSHRPKITLARLTGSPMAAEEPDADELADTGELVPA